MYNLNRTKKIANPVNSRTEFEDMFKRWQYEFDNTVKSRLTFDNLKKFILKNIGEIKFIYFIYSILPFVSSELDEDSYVCFLDFLKKSGVELNDWKSNN